MIDHRCNSPELKRDIPHTLKSGRVVQEPPHHNGGSLSPDRPSATQRDSPEASSTASDSPTPTNSVQEKNWTESHWQGLEIEERCQLLCTEEESSDRHSSGSDSEHDSENDSNSLWTISAEQRQYYCQQFRRLQPDMTGLLTGAKAKEFFDRSKLPLNELRKIWQLANVSRNGQLSLEEFNIAMHLVVVRRNGIQIPDVLPPSLVPATVGPPAPAPPAPPPAAAEYKEKPGSKESLTSISSLLAEHSPQKGNDVQLWTKFVDSPTSSVSSPGPKPVNFDFHKSAVEQDPKILHPVALRLTPESQIIANVNDGEDQCRSPRRLGSDPGYEGDLNIAPDIRPIQRPQPKKPAAPGPGAIPPPPPPQLASTAGLEDTTLQTPSGSQLSGPTSLPMGLKKEPPPPPPPRPYRTHARSSSLDLNRLDAVTSKNSGLLGAPPVVPPRVSPSAMSPKKLTGQFSEGSDPTHQGFADFAQFDSQPDCDVVPRRHGAFEVYRKPTKNSSTAVPDASGEGHEEVVHSRQNKNVEESSTVQYLQAQNSMLLHVVQDLTIELTKILTEKSELEALLEHCSESQPH